MAEESGETGQGADAQAAATSFQQKSRHAAEGGGIPVADLLATHGAPTDNERARGEGDTVKFFGEQAVHEHIENPANKEQIAAAVTFFDGLMTEPHAPVKRGKGNNQFRYIQRVRPSSGEIIVRSQPEEALSVDNNPTDRVVVEAFRQEEDYRGQVIQRDTLAIRRDGTADLVRHVPINRAPTGVVDYDGAILPATAADIREAVATVGAWNDHKGRWSDVEGRWIQDADAQPIDAEISAAKRLFDTPEGDMGKGGQLEYAGIDATGRALVIVGGEIDGQKTEQVKIGKPGSMVTLDTTDHLDAIGPSGMPEGSSYTKKVRGPDGLTRLYVVDVPKNVDMDNSREALPASVIEVMVHPDEDTADNAVLTKLRERLMDAPHVPFTEHTPKVKVDATL